ncbi:hypothetical protein AGR8A_Lc10040 [Agrobacterium fabrum str. J-07]|nr:hypothetical protein AGR8A_Lc10040 [Agrobacterium fabrum str. J-07]
MLQERVLKTGKTDACRGSTISVA